MHSRLTIGQQAYVEKYNYKLQIVSYL